MNKNTKNKAEKVCLTRKGAICGYSFMLGLLLASMGWGKYNLLIILVLAAVIPPLFFIFPERKKYKKLLLTCVVFVMAAIGYNSLYTKLNYDRITALDGKNVAVKGYIKDYEYLGSETCLITVKGKIDGISGTICFYAPYGDFDYYDKITAKLKAEKITDSVNFLSESYNRPKGIYIQGDNVSEYSIGKNVNPIFREITHYRDYCLGKIKSKCGKQEGQFLSAMLCGDKSELSQADKTLSYRCGIGHLLAVSGAHLVILANLISLFLKGIKNKKIRFAVTMAVIWSFAVFSGLSVSVIRAAFLVTILRSAFIFGRRGDAANSLGLCVIILTAACPYIVRSPSFLLTITATFVMEVVLPEYMINKKGIFIKFGNLLITYLLIMFTMLPVNLVLFGGVSVISPLTNMVIAPVCTLAMCFGFVFMLTGCISYFAPLTILIANKLMSLAVKMIEFCGNMPFCYVYGKYPLLNVLMISASIFWIVYAFFQRKKKSTVKVISFGAILLVTAEIFYILLNFTGKDRQKCEICAISGGRGCEYVLNTPDCFVIFDYGAKGKSNSGVVRYMEKNGVENVDYAFLLDGEYDFTQFKNDIFCSPKTIFAQSYWENNENVKDFDIGSYFQKDNLIVRQKDDGYYVTYGEFNIRLSRKYFVVDKDKYKITNDTGALIIDIDSQKVRRVNCGFD